MLKRISTLPLQVVLTVPFVLLILVTGTLIGYLTFQNSQSVVNALAVQLHTAVTARIRERLDDYLAAPQLINQLNLDSIHLDQVKLHDLDSLGRHFMIQIQRFDSVASIAYANEQQEYVGATQKINGLTQTFSSASTQNILRSYRSNAQGDQLEPIGSSIPHYDPRQRPWYQAAVQAGRPTWTPVYIWSEGYVGLDAVIPIYSEEGKLTGVLDTSLTLTGIGDFLQSLQIAQHGQAFIMERSGLLVAASSIKTPYTRTGNELKRLAALDSSAPVVRSAAQQLAQQFGAVANITASQPFYFDLTGERYFAHVTPYKDTYGLDWMIVVVVPVSDFMAQIYTNNGNTALLVVLSLLVSVGIATLLARRVTRPISRLNQSARTLAHGDWTQKVVIGRNDEVGELARAFNQMAEQLQATFASLQVSEERYRSLFEGVPIGIYRSSPAGQVIDVNPALLKMFGAPDLASALTPNAGAFYANADQRTQWQADLERAGGSSSFEAQVYSHDRRVIWVQNNAQIVRDADGNVLYYEGTLEDITARKQAEAALRDSEVRFRAIFEHAAIGMGLTDIRGCSIAANPALTAMLGYSADELHGMHFSSYTHPEDLDNDAILFDQLMAGTREFYAIQKRYMSKDNKVVWVNLRISLIRTASGAPQFAIGMIEDVTEHKRLEQQYLQAQKMDSIGRLASGIAHDFNNLLTVIIGNTDMLLDEVGRDHPFRHDIVQIRDAADRAAVLTRQLLAFSRNQVLVPSIIDLNVVVAGIAPMLRRLIGEHITLSTSLAPMLGRVLADPGQLEQVIVNLVVNARDAMPQGGNLIVETTNAILDAPVPGAYVLLAISDTGIGMDAATREQIFEPFFTTKEVGKGSGLGLATVYGIITQSGGHIWVHSEVGHGTTFKAYLPLCDAPDQPITECASDVEAAIATGNTTILLVEDDVGVRELSERLMRGWGHQVLVASNAQAALRVAAESPDPINLLLTDVIMPGGTNGVALAEQLLVAYPTLRVLYMSGYTDMTLTSQAMLPPDQTLLMKPFTAKTLARTIRAALTPANM